MNHNDVFIIHGTDYKNMARQVLKQANLAEEIGLLSRKIGLKPNLVNATDPSMGATTHREILAGAIEYLREHGFQDITILESSWVGELTQNALRAAGYDRICDKYGVPFIDLQKDSWKEYDARGMKIKLCDTAARMDYMINLPVLKGHCQTTVTCALKNNKGVIPNSEKRRFHTLGLHNPIAHLNTIVRNDFILVDNICGDLDFEEGGNPVVMNRVLGFRDPVLCDAFVCSCMGYSPDQVPYIQMAENLGVGSADLSQANMIYLNQDKGHHSGLKMTRRVRRLAAFTEPKYACSACYGSLIHALDRLNEAGYLTRNLPPVCIGQGFQGKKGRIGVGQCTSCFEKSLEGCPPKAVDMVNFLKAHWRR